MTIPDLDLDGLMPYTVTFYPATGVLMYPDVDQRGDWPSNYLRHRLGPGFYMIQLTYFSNGADLKVRSERTGIPGIPEILGIPGGETGWLTSPMLRVSVSEGTEMFLRLQSNSGFGVAREGLTAALTVYPMPTFTP